MESHSPSSKKSIIPPTSSKYLIPIIGFLYEGLDSYICDLNRNFLNYISENLILPDLLFKIHYKIAIYCEKNKFYIEAIEHLKFCLLLMKNLHVKLPHKELKIKNFINSLIESDKKHSPENENKIYEYFKGNAFYKLKDAEDLFLKISPKKERPFINLIGNKNNIDSSEIKSSNGFYTNKQGDNDFIIENKIEDFIKNLKIKKIYHKFFELKNEFSFYFKVNFISIYFT